MADTEYVRLIALVPQDVACRLRQGISQPVGIAPRRPIAETVVKNLRRQVPSCLRAGEINASAASYLAAWSEGTLQTVPKPDSYPLLLHRWDPEVRAEEVNPGAWQRPLSFVYQKVCF